MMYRIRPLIADDLPLGLHLSRQAGWNQLEADWRRALELQPEGCFVAEWNGKAAGTTTTCIFGSVAWIAMVLVEESLRGRGIGAALMVHALAYLDHSGVATVRLDATPLGKPLYEGLGFAEQFRLARYEGNLPPLPLSPSAQVETAVSSDWEALTALDETATRTNRRKLLKRLCGEEMHSVRCVRHSGCVTGFLTSRPGAKATYLGSCIASTEAGPLLLADALDRYAGQRVFIDMPETNEAAIRLVETRGLSIQRYLTRMCRGVTVCEQIPLLWGSSGPEKG
jgi:ribosomal protein S18 acetylase RimI-like enzyme